MDQSHLLQIVFLIDVPDPRDLVVSVNWIGDAIMAMPALQVYRRRYPENHIAVLARGVIADLWKLHAAPDEVIRYDGRPGIFHPLHAMLNNRAFDCAWVLPNSFRSALLAFRSQVPVRKGVAGGCRNLLLTHVLKPEVPAMQRHQAWEYIHLLNPGAALSELPNPELQLPAQVVEHAAQKFGRFDRPVVGIIPGAARGPSKRWPVEHYMALARRYVKEGCSVIAFGGPDDVEVCDRITAEVSEVISLAGRTSLAEWAAMMNQCSVIIANDSGGMHLTAALHVPLVALFGMTDPERTGPIGRQCVLIQKSKTRSRDIPRNSAEAVKSLAAIRPDEVFEAARPFVISGKDDREV